VEGFSRVPFGDLAALEEAVSDATGAVLIEAIQHEAGVVVPPDGYLAGVRDICDRRNIIFILDEIKTGIGKTGRMFACEHENAVPDILVLGKSLGGGLMPVGAVVAREKLWKRFGMSFSISASSFAGNVLACRAAIETIRCVRKGDLIAQCRAKGELLLERFAELARAYPDVVRTASGRGLLIGLEARNAAIAMMLAREMITNNVLTLPAYGNAACLMIEPPLVISFDQVKTVADTFTKACETIMREMNG
jgi:putrescine aminotransferase